MSLDRAFQMASRLLALAGLSALIFTRELFFPLTIAAILSVGASFILALSESTFRLSKRTWTGVNLVVLAFFVVDLFFISSSLLVASTHFIVFLMINKLFNLNTSQDHLQLYLISFLQLLAASTFTIEISFLVAFILYLLAAIWALLLHHLVTEGARQSSGSVPRSSPGGPQGITWPFFLSTNGIAVVALGCTLILFAFIPRIGLGFFHRSQSDLIRMSGFSNQVNLGDIGDVKLDSTVVMRVQPQPAKPLPLFEGIYWRGMAFDHFDGEAWRNSFGSGGLLSSEGRGVFKFGTGRYPQRTVTQEIILEPLDTAILFGLPNMIQVTGHFPRLKMNTMRSVSQLAVPASRVDYIVTSQSPVLTRGDAEARTVSYPSSVQGPFLQLPESTDLIRQLAVTITQSSDTVLKKVLAVEQYLEANYRYTLDVEPPTSGSPIEDFLFRQKAGFCEHYATGMTLLLRTIGIPARLVTGFLPGEWNEFGKFYTVRQSDAHSWVEVWFPESGWYPFDPTPSAPTGSGSTLFGLFSQSIDSLKWQWNRYVIYYGLRDQIRLATEAKNNTVDLARWVSAKAHYLLQGMRTWLLHMEVHPVILAAGAILGGWAAFLIFRRFRIGNRWRSAFHWALRKWPVRGETHGRALFYFRMLDLLRRKGYVKPDTLTPQEFLGRIPELPAAAGTPPLGPAGPAGPANTSMPLASPRAVAAELTHLYYRVRFAAVPLSGAEEKQVSRLLSEMETVLDLS